jgi:hypothetical protein
MREATGSRPSFQIVKRNISQISSMTPSKITEQREVKFNLLKTRIVKALMVKEEEKKSIPDPKEQRRELDSVSSAIKAKISYRLELKKKRGVLRKVLSLLVFMHFLGSVKYLLENYDDIREELGITDIEIKPEMMQLVPKQPNYQRRMTQVKREHRLSAQQYEALTKKGVGFGKIG